jgi:hypothetical protein
MTEERDYLEVNLETVANLPSELKRSFALMRELDEKVQGAMI